MLSIQHVGCRAHLNVRHTICDATRPLYSTLCVVMLPRFQTAPHTLFLLATLRGHTWTCNRGQCVCGLVLVGTWLPRAGSCVWVCGPDRLRGECKVAGGKIPSLRGMWHVRTLVSGSNTTQQPGGPTGSKMQAPGVGGNGEDRKRRGMDRVEGRPGKTGR